MTATPRILIVGPDRTLPQEVEAALTSIDEVRAVTHYVSDIRQGIESARSRRPDIALIEMSGDDAHLRLFVEEVRSTCPETAIAAVFHPSTFSESASESDVVIHALRLGVQDFLRRPVSSTDLRQFLHRRMQRSKPTQAAAGTVATVFANKGGVGKTTVSTNLAVALARENPGRVLLIDGSLQLGVCASLLDLEPERTLTDAAHQRDRLDETLIRELAIGHESGLHLLAAPRDAVEATRIDDEVISRVITLARRAFDTVIVDTFPMLDAVMMAVLDLTDIAYLATEAVVPTLRGSAQLMGTLDQLGIPRERRRIVLNRYATFDGNQKPDEVAKRLGQPVDHILPYDRKLLIAANSGEPFVLKYPRKPFTRAIGKIAAEVNAVGAARPIAEPA
mgnify:FL=1